MRPVHECSARELIAEARRRDENRRAGRPLDYVAADVRTPEQLEADDARREKELVREADRRMRAAGFTVWNLSQPRASKLTAGIPDRLYTCPSRGLAVFWEAKSATGRQRPDQRVFQEHADATGLHYVVGPPHELYAWCQACGVTVPLT